VAPSSVEQSETIRRRSTVREPAPGAASEVTAANPPPTASPLSSPSSSSEPVITDTNEASEGERPRRTGWWSRRFAGG
jgi:ribonuclease E